MIIAVTAGSVELQAADDFKGFKIAGIATVEPDGTTAWVKQAAVKRLRAEQPPAEWVAAFDKMVESVRRFGWVKDDSVRAHIETA